MGVLLNDVFASIEHASQCHFIQIGIVGVFVSSAVDVTRVGRLVYERKSQQRFKTSLGKFFAHFTRRLEFKKIIERIRVNRAPVQNGQYFLYELLRHQARMRQYVVAYELDHLTIDHFVVLYSFQRKLRRRNTFN